MAHRSPVAVHIQGVAGEGVATCVAVSAEKFRAGGQRRRSADGDCILGGRTATGEAAINIAAYRALQNGDAVAYGTTTIVDTAVDAAFHVAASDADAVAYGVAIDAVAAINILVHCAVRDGDAVACDGAGTAHCAENIAGYRAPNDGDAVAYGITVSGVTAINVAVRCAVRDGGAVACGGAFKIHCAVNITSHCDVRDGDAVAYGVAIIVETAIDTASYAAAGDGDAVVCRRASGDVQRTIDIQTHLAACHDDAVAGGGFGSRRDSAIDSAADCAIRHSDRIVRQTGAGKKGIGIAKRIGRQHARIRAVKDDGFPGDSGCIEKKRQQGCCENKEGRLHLLILSSVKGMYADEKK